MALPALVWSASPNVSSRNGNHVHLIVVHDCEGSYKGSVSWFALTRAEVSAHIVLSEDGALATQMVAWANKAWHVCDFNGYSEGIEAAGYAAKGLGEPEWEALASIVAFRLHANGIPCQVATAENDWVGYCQHQNLGVKGGGHHDITEDTTVWQAFVSLVEKAYNEPQPAEWVPFGTRAVPPAPVNFKPSNTVRHDFVEGSLEWVQMRLNSLHMAPVLTVDGIEGDETKKVIELFQAAHQLSVDGIVGTATVEALKIAA